MIKVVPQMDVKLGWFFVFPFEEAFGTHLEHMRVHICYVWTYEWHHTVLWDTHNRPVS